MGGVEGPVAFHRQDKHVYRLYLNTINYSTYYRLNVTVADCPASRFALCRGLFVEELRKRDCLEDLCIDGRIRLRWSRLILLEGLY